MGGPSSSHSYAACPSYGALFFRQLEVVSADDQLEEREHERAVRFIVQEMAHWKTTHSAPSTPHKYSDKVGSYFLFPSMPRLTHRCSSCPPACVHWTPLRSPSFYWEISDLSTQCIT